MRLPLRHAPPGVDAPLRRCAHLESLAEAAVGMPLGPAAAMVASRRSRGRHGNALQWHFGLSSHDGDATLDWEDRIEIKLVSVWRRGMDGRRGLGCDKLKVCDVAIDPWRKLSNVLWVFADRLTRVVVAARAWRLAGAGRARLETAWHTDPHFGDPLLFVEAREHAGRRAPAYYLAARWFHEEGLLPPDGPGVLPFDGRWWNRVRREHGRDPLATIVDDAGAPGPVACPRCGGPISYESEALAALGWAPARHGMPLEGVCGTAGHFVVAAAHMIASRVQSPAEFRAAIESRLDTAKTWRLTERVPEPDDHGHGSD
jgi:hypothetical protein